MSRKHKIRWQESDTDELTKAVKNFNAKITRIEKKNPELKNALPEKMSARQLKELINTRQDLKRELNALRRFTDKNNKIGITDDGTYQGIEIYGDYNIKITKWQRKEINRRVAVINRRRKQRLEVLENIEVTSKGQKQGYTKGQLEMGRVEMIELQPMEGLTPGTNEVEVRKKFKSILIQSQSDFYSLKDFRTKANYITGLYNNFNEADIKEIVDTIKDMPLDKFLETFHSDPDAKFEGLYAPNQSQYGKYVKSLKAVWMPNR